MLTGQEPEDLPHKGLAVDVRAALGKRVSSDLVEVLTRMLEPDPDKRAGVIPSFDPLRESLRSEPDREKAKPRAPLRADREERRRRKEEREATFKRLKEEAREEREARRAEKKARRQQRRDGWRPAALRPRISAPPFPISWLFALGIAFGMLAVAIALRFGVPFFLRALSLLFAKEGLRRAASEVRAAGDRAIRSMDRAVLWSIGQSATAPFTRIDASPTPEVRVKVDEPEASEQASEEDPEEEESEPKKRAKR
jgi:hypothetical protein